MSDFGEKSQSYSKDFLLTMCKSINRYLNTILLFCKKPNIYPTTNWRARIAFINVLTDVYSSMVFLKVLCVCVCVWTISQFQITNLSLDREKRMKKSPDR